MIAFKESSATPKFATATTKNLRPISEESAEFLRDYYAHYKHQPIRAVYDHRPAWLTYEYIGLDELIKAWRDEEELVGVRPGSKANQLVIDIDPGSKYHPHPAGQTENWTEVENIRTVLLNLGLESVLFYSSDRAGIHIRVFLPEAVNALHLGAAVEYALADKGYILKNGEIELSPRIKQYDPDPTKIKLHQAFRLPMQRGGAYIGIGYEVEEREDNLDFLVKIIKRNIEEHDIDILKAAMSRAYDRLYESNKNQIYVPTARGKAAKFKESMEARMERGFTGQGQTNELMKEALKYGYIFLRLTGEELKNWLHETMETMPGYKEYCGHQHEMEKKAAVWQRWIEKSRYYPFGGKVPVTVGSLEGEQNRNQTKSEAALAKLKLVVGQINETCETVKDVFAKIRDKAAEFKNFQTKFSNSTLYKPEYRQIWEKLLNVAPRETLHTFEESSKTAEKADRPNPSPETASEDYTPLSIECLAPVEAEPRSLGAASNKQFSGPMRVSDSADLEFGSQTEVSQLIEDREVSIEAVRAIWLNTYLQAKALLDRISPAVIETHSAFVYEQEILAARLKLFWAGVPPAWTDFARSWLQELNINVKLE